MGALVASDIVLEVIAVALTLFFLAIGAVAYVVAKGSLGHCLVIDARARTLREMKGAKVLLEVKLNRVMACVDPGE